MLLRRSARPTKRRLQNLPRNERSKSKNATLQLLKKLAIVQILASKKPHTEQQKIRQSVVVLQLEQVVLTLVSRLHPPHLKSACTAAQSRRPQNSSR
jgi:hypothetical protein